MAGSTRIKGNNLALQFGGTDFWADTSAITLENEEADSGVTTYADAQAGGGRQFYLRGSAIQSTQTGSFWRYVWANTGQTIVYRYAPWGNPVATADQPHYTGTVVIGPKPTLGGEAGTEDFTFDFEWKVVGEPVPDYGTAAQAAITTITPAGRSAGQTVQITGTRFAGVSDVKFGTTSVATGAISFVSDSVIVVTVPSGTGSKAVTVITPAGTSPSVNYTVS